MPDHAKATAYYDHPFFGKWPAITENQFGSGTLLYEGTYLSDTLQTALLKRTLDRRAGLTGPDQQLPHAPHVQHGVNRDGQRFTTTSTTRRQREVQLWVWRRYQFAGWQGPGTWPGDRTRAWDLGHSGRALS